MKKYIVMSSESTYPSVYSKTPMVLRVKRAGEVIWTSDVLSSHLRSLYNFCVDEACNDLFKIELYGTRSQKVSYQMEMDGEDFRNFVTYLTDTFWIDNDIGLAMNFRFFPASFEMHPLSSVTLKVSIQQHAGKPRDSFHFALRRVTKSGDAYGDSSCRPFATTHAVAQVNEPVQATFQLSCIGSAVSEDDKVDSAHVALLVYVGDKLLFSNHRIPRESVFSGSPGTATLGKHNEFACTYTFAVEPFSLPNAAATIDDVRDANIRAILQAQQAEILELRRQLESLQARLEKN